jgi:hypothetical protein
VFKIDFVNSSTNKITLLKKIQNLNLYFHGDYVFKIDFVNSSTNKIALLKKIQNLWHNSIKNTKYFIKCFYLIGIILI